MFSSPPELGVCLNEDVPTVTHCSLFKEAAQRIVAEGIDAVLADRDVDAERIAAETRDELIQIQGTDVNKSEAKIIKIRELAKESQDES